MSKEKNNGMKKIGIERIITIALFIAGCYTTYLTSTTSMKTDIVLLQNDITLLKESKADKTDIDAKLKIIDFKLGLICKGLNIAESEELCKFVAINNLQIEMRFWIASVANLLFIE